MSFIKWQEGFLTGIPEVDAQHQRLIETLNTLHFLLKHGGSHEEILEILRFLDNYTVEHFGTEEDLMEKADGKFPKELRERHLREHRYFIDKVQEFHGVFDAYRNGEQEREAILKLFAFLSHWLCEHILKTDKETASYLR
ncbi:MAG: hemerythrin family protein [Thermodesulfobacteria bacterium]|nr:hemerythrin family protein [Thermodesulfobacteriota bacterium]